MESYLSFTLGGEHFAANVSKVLEILEVTRITRVPKSPDFMAGVINLRGGVLPVVDTRLKFGMAPVEMTVNTCIIVLHVNVEGEDMQLGALVDSVQEVIEIDKNEIKPPPRVGSSMNTSFLEGIFKLDDQFIMLLQVDRVFSSEEIIQIKMDEENLIKETE